MYLRIVNKGEVDPKAFSLVGASTKKEDNTKIGMFGSGNKYAIAYLFRNGYKFKLFSGNNYVHFSTRATNFKGKDFEIIEINAEITSITTEMGSHWVLWQAIRELYSNAVDEGFVDFGMVESIPENHEPDNTYFYIEAKEELFDLCQNIGDYFAIQKDVLFECEIGKIYKKQSAYTCVYRKGIRCFDTDMKSLFDYDFNHISIDENRMVKYSWSLPQEMWKLLYKCDNEYVIRTVLNNIKSTDLIERNIDDSFVNTYNSNMSDAWKKCLQGSQVAPRDMGGYVKDSDRASTKIIPNRLYTDIISKFGEELKPKSFRSTSTGVNYTIVQPTELMITILKGVLDFFKECRFEINYPIDIVDFNNKDIHGGVTKDTICIGVNAFDKGSVWVANVIIEEYVHLKYDAPDESRRFQDEVIGMFLTYMQEINAFKL